MRTNETFNLHGISIRIIEPDILRFDVPTDMHITLDIIKDLWVFGNEHLPGVKRKVLGILNSNFVPSKDAADFMVSKTRSETLAAEAFVINSALLKLKTNFYFMIKKPPVKSRAFDDEAMALAWLRSL